MDYNDFRGIYTIFLMVLFIGIWVWAWSSKREKAFREAANLPFADEEPGNQPRKNEEISK